jgi:hypothetical protein
MNMAVSRQPLTAETHLQSQVSLGGIRGGQSGTGTGFPQITSGLSRHYTPPVLHAHPFSHHRRYIIYKRQLRSIFMS